MEGPDDAAIEAQLSGVELTAREAEEEPPPPSPGGKPLLRLLSLLGAAGYDSAAQATIELAVNRLTAFSVFTSDKPRRAAAPGCVLRPGNLLLK